LACSSTASPQRNELDDATAVLDAFHVVGLLSEQWPDRLHTGVPIVPGRSGKAYATDCSFGPSPGPGVPEVLIDAERVDVGEPVRMRSAPGLTS
jgi:hypothetical protein